jgi:SOS-response transcriptional repressor LexA
MLSPRRAQFSVLEFAGAPAGLLLLDTHSGVLHQRLRPAVATEDDDLYALLPDEIAAQARELGAERLLDLFEDTLSNTVTISDRRPVLVHDFEAALGRLYEEHILGVRMIRTPAAGIPLYSLRAAAGRFGEDIDVLPEGRVPAPPGLAPSPDLYAVHVAGHSMEPEVPDGAVAVFRYAPAGSRRNKRVLVWRSASSAEGGEFTLKVYESEKTVTEEGWQHTRIRLKPLNPGYPVLELDENSDYRVLGELVRVLAIDEL